MSRIRIDDSLKRRFWPPKYGGFWNNRSTLEKWVCFVRGVWVYSHGLGIHMRPAPSNRAPARAHQQDSTSPNWLPLICTDLHTHIPMRPHDHQFDWRQRRITSYTTVIGSRVQRTFTLGATKPSHLTSPFLRQTLYESNAGHLLANFWGWSDYFEKHYIHPCLLSTFYNVYYRRHLQK